MLHRLPNTPFLKTMGRADDLKSFVKIPEEEGYIELELKNASGKQM